MANDFAPVHPGEIVRSEIYTRERSAEALSQASSVPRSVLADFFDERTLLSNDDARKASLALGLSGDFIGRLQDHYRGETT